MFVARSGATTVVAGQVDVAARYDMGPATRDFVPRVSIAEDLERLRLAWRDAPV